MPVCKNDPTRYYRGTETSPKGRGYCAHGEEEGKNGLSKTDDGLEKQIRIR
jgi:hypothetical protein